MRNAFMILTQYNWTQRLYDCWHQLITLTYLCCST